MTNKQLQELALKVMEGKVNLNDLPTEQVDAVIMRTYDCAVELLDNPRCEEAAQQIIDELQPFYDEILSAGSEEFEAAIVEAENRGSIFCNISSDMLH